MVNREEGRSSCHLVLKKTPKVKVEDSLSLGAQIGRFTQVEMTLDIVS
jgi:hypothetical protein